jgi:hypothetical protein
LEEEFALLDRVGRLQIPAHFIETLGLKDRVKIDLETDHISVWPDRDADESTLPALTSATPAVTEETRPAVKDDHSRWRRPG